MKLAYFVHDLTDPAVARRIRMLQAGGAEPVLLGFRRSATAPSEVAGVAAIDLGRTYDGRLGHRARAAALVALGAGRWRSLLGGAEVVMARTLEMLAVADAARLACGLRAPLAYECLDIHRVMLQDTLKGYALRTAERRLMRRADLLITSSPAFVENYFRPIQGVGDDVRIPVLLLENKVLELESLGPARSVRPAGAPWRIGWLGALRCQKSLDILSDLAARRPDLVEVRLHGRPALTEFRDFDAQVGALPNLTFGGPYAPADLPQLYGDVHFAWAIDYMEEGLNSSWLLPNRVYESGRFGAVPIALSDVETGRWLARQGIGVRLERPEDLEGFLEGMNGAAYADLRTRVEAAPRSVFAAGLSDCRRLVEGLKMPSRASGSHGQAGEDAKARLAA